MTSNRQKVWLITGASSSLGYRLCVAALARGDLVIASAASKRNVDRLCAAGAYGIQIDSDMSFGQIKSRIHEAVAYHGGVDFLINNPELESQSGHDFPSNVYEANTFSYTAIQVTKAVSQESTIRQVVVVVPDEELDYSQGSSSDTNDNVEGIAQLLAAEYRSRRTRVLLVKPRHIVSSAGSRHANGDTRVAVERIIAKLVYGGLSEPGIRVL
ncbi:hypothetical protein K439DRAFT_1156319 [Ramaria rubella]|nr:hypothetical protein K439DRAFT_1156319 [Ramaria rubella]